MTTQPLNEEAIFQIARRICGAEARDQYLHQACSDNQQLRKRVELLLDAQRDDGFLKSVAEPNLTAIHRREIEQPGMHIGRYKLMEQIGEGGMGTVWVAEQSEPIRRRVALKLIKPGMDSRQVLSRFDAERQALALMDHPNIAKVYDGGMTDEGRPYFVMELVHGVPITTFCDENRLTPRERMELFVRVCQAIQHAHQKGIIHRDIKPTNVLVTMYDDQAVPKVIDFGVAKALENQLTEGTIYTQYGTVVGTFEYMSPEQAEMSALGVDTRSDIYSLGVLLYELLTGSTPLDRGRVRSAAFNELIRLIREEEPQLPSMRLSSSETLASLAVARRTEPANLSRLFRGEVDWIVMRCLEKDRKRRYETASSLARDVERYLRDEPVEACPPTFGYRLKKVYRKHRAAVGIAATFLIMLTAAAVISTALAIQARRSERLALAERARAEEREREAIEHRQRAEQEQQRAERERERAELEKRTAQAVRDFLHKDLLAQASLFSQAEAQRLTDGNFAVKSNPTVNELLDRASAQLAPDKIEAKFPRLPQVQAEVLMTVGDAYFQIGQDQKAFDLLERAVEKYRAAGAFADPAALEARQKLAIAHFVRGQRSEAEKQLEAVVADKTRVLGLYHPDTLDGQTQLGELYSINRSKDAVEYLTRVRDLAQTHLGPEHVNTLLAGGTLAMALRAAGRAPDAVREMEAIREVCKRLQIRPDHPGFQRGVANLALAYLAANRREDAIALLEEALASWEKLGDPVNPATWLHRHYLTCWKYVNTGQSEAAIPHFERNLAASVFPWQEMHTRGELYSAHMALGRFEEALAHVQKSYDQQRTAYGPDYQDWHLGKTRARIGLALAAQEKYAEAEPLLVAGYDEMVAHQGQMPGHDQGRLPEVEKAILDLYKSTNRPDGAQKWLAKKLSPLEQDLKRLQDGKTTTSPEALRAVAKLAQAYVDVGRKEAAFKLFDQTFARCQDNGWPLDDASLKALSTLRLTVRRADRFDLAVEMTTEIVAALRKQSNSSQDIFLRELSALGLELCLANQHAAAEAPLRELLQAWQARDGNSWEATKAKRWLGRSLLRQKKYTDAEQILLESNSEVVERIALAPAWEKHYFGNSAGDLVELYAALEDAEEVAKWKAELAKRRQAAANSNASNQ